MVFQLSAILGRLCWKRSIYCNVYNLYQPYFITFRMRNTSADNIITSMEFEHRIGKPSQPNRGKPEHCQESELYELCQQLTRQNRHLKRQVSDLRKLIAAKQEHSFEFVSEQQEDVNYRQLNYDCYKKKAMNLLTSLKFIHNLYTEKCSIDKRTKLLESFMGKIRQGNPNHIDELLRLYEECLKGREDDSWNLDELQRQSSQYQNNILRKHIKRLNSILLQSVSSLKHNLNSIKIEIVTNHEKANRQLHHFCQKYMQFGEEPKMFEPQISQTVKVPPQNMRKQKKKKAAANKENEVHKASWEKIINQRAKMKESHLQQNVKQKIHESLLLVESQQRNTMPLCNNKPYIPKPPSRSKKQQITIIDQLKNSKSFVSSSLTPSNDANKNRSHFRNSRKNSIKNSSQGPSCKKSQNHSPKKTCSYYR